MMRAFFAVFSGAALFVGLYPTEFGTPRTDAWCFGCALTFALLSLTFTGRKS